MSMSINTIEKSTIEDLGSTLKLFIKVTDKMLANNIDQWNYDYPDKKTITKDILSGNHYVIRDKGAVVGTIVLDDNQDDQYRNVHWSTRNSRILVIHRLGVHPDYQGQGIGKRLCLFAEEFGRNHNFKAIRLDAYSGNDSSNRLYKGLGYSRVNGLCYFRKKVIPFYCYDKVLI